MDNPKRNLISKQHQTLDYMQYSQLTANTDAIFCHEEGTAPPSPPSATPSPPSCLMLDDQFFIVPGALAPLVFDFNKTAKLTTTFESRAALLSGSTPDAPEAHCPNEDIPDSWFNAHLIAAGVTRHVMPAGTARTCLAYTSQDFSLNVQLKPKLSEANQHVLESTLHRSNCTASRRRAAAEPALLEEMQALPPRCPEPCSASPHLLQQTLGHTCRWECEWFALPENAMKPATCKPHPASAADCASAAASGRHLSPCRDAAEAEVGHHGHPHGWISRIARWCHKAQKRVQDFIAL